MAQLRLVKPWLDSGLRIVLAPLRAVVRHLTAIRIFFSAVPSAISFYQGSLQLALFRVFGVFRREGLRGVRRRASILMHGVNVSQTVTSNRLYGNYPQKNKAFQPKVSVIVPNFNHAAYLVDRLDSIYNQSYGNFEVILLDDCSSDQSTDILRSFAQRYPKNTICIFNETNSGGVFNQWKKGLTLATGELVWIAESDDSCTTNLLEELVCSFQNPAVRLAFARTEFVGGMPPRTNWTSEEYLSELGLKIWDKAFIKSAHAMVKSAWVVKNIIPNVSSALFRHPGKLSLLDDAHWRHLRLCGDWIFYLSIIRGGLIAYSPHATNYYRMHALNTSVNAQKEDLYYREHHAVALHLANLYLLGRSDFERQEQHLYLHWCIHRGQNQRAKFKELYNIDQICQHMATRKPNLVMAVYALAAGGGETFPIMLANLLSARGYAITLLNCKEQVTVPGIRQMLSPGIALMELDRLESANAVFKDMGVELVHSHHAWVDVSLATYLLDKKNIKLIVTMHGMYETMSAAQLTTLLPLMTRQIDRFIYTAEKNLAPFSPEVRVQKNFCHINNALPLANVNPVARSALHIGTNDFLLCLVARAIPDKGWAQAVEAVMWAAARSGRKIQLILIGEGPEHERLKSQTLPDYIHLLGFKSNVRNYFAAADLGFLPTMFRGESAPLVLIDCLLAGKPVLATDVGEIRQMLATDGGLAGELVALEGWAIPVETLGQVILTLANNAPAYQRLLSRVPQAAAKFDPNVMADKYEQVYREALS